MTAFTEVVCMLAACLWPYTINFKLENVEHFGGEPEQADTGISCYW